MTGDPHVILDDRAGGEIGDGGTTVGRGGKATPTQHPSQLTAESARRIKRKAVGSRLAQGVEGSTWEHAWHK